MSKRRTASELFAKHIDFARWLAMRQLPTATALGLDLDDAYQDALVGLWQASRAFKARRGVKFRSFAKFRIAGAIQDGFRRYAGASMMRRGIRHPVLRAFGGEDDFRVSSYQVDDDTLGCRHDPPDHRAVDADRRDHGTDLYAAIAAHLDRRTAHVMRMRAGGLTLRSIGECMGVTESRVSQIVKEAQRVLRGRLRKAYA